MCDCMRTCVCLCVYVRAAGWYVHLIPFWSQRIANYDLEVIQSFVINYGLEIVANF